MTASPKGAEDELARARKWKFKNIDKVRAYRKAYYQKNKDRELENHKKWVEKNPDLFRTIKRKCDAGYRIKNATEIAGHRRSSGAKALRNKRNKMQYRSNVLHRAECLERSRFKQALKRKLFSDVILIMCGCSLVELRTYIESKFTGGMTWENYGAWHIDHIIPVRYFDLTITENVGKCFHFSNLQPLWAKDNFLKSANEDKLYAD